jgi:Domain of unknown function (DUF397)
MVAPFKHRTRRGWFKTKHSGPDGHCVEVNVDSRRKVGIRDSKDRGGPALWISPADFDGFLDELRANMYSLPASS